MTESSSFIVKVDGFSYKEVKRYGDTLIEMPRSMKEKNRVGKNKKYSYSAILFPWDKIEEFYTSETNKTSLIDSLVEDFLTIALSTYYIDQIPKRKFGKKKRDKRRYYFSRNIKITIPVHNLHKWKTAKVQLEKTLSFLTCDNINYKFIKRKKCIKTSRLQKRRDKFTSVSLFSGGLDSLSGYVYLVEEKKENPIFVSVLTRGIGKIVKNLIKDLDQNSNFVLLESREKNPKLKDKKKLKEIKKLYHKNDSKYQFSRSFLYLTCAVAIALAFKDIKKIYMPENGIMAWNIGLGESRLSTRTAHPTFLKYYQSLLDKLFPHSEIKIENPFELKTKGEVVSYLKEKEELIKKSVSCSHYNFKKKRNGEILRHCGMCIPCIYRTISIISNNIDDSVVKVFGKQIFQSNFTIENFEKEFPQVKQYNKIIKSYFNDGIVNILDILRFVTELKGLSDEKLKIKYPEFLDEKVLDMYKRFANESTRTFCHFAEKNEYLKEIITQMGDKNFCKTI